MPLNEPKHGQPPVIFQTKTPLGEFEVRGTAQPGKLVEVNGTIQGRTILRMGHILTAKQARELWLALGRLLP